MKARNLRPKISRKINWKTNEDVLFTIMIKLDVQHIFLLWLATYRVNRYWKEKNNISNVLRKHIFWQLNAYHNLQPQQLAGVTNFPQLMLDRYEAYKVIENEL